MRAADMLRVALSGLRVRPARAALSALGVAIGIATMIAVLGVSASSQAELTRALDRLGTNLLTVAPGVALFGGQPRLPLAAPAMIRSADSVLAASQTGDTGAPIYRSDRIPRARTGGLQVRATGLDLLQTLQTRVRRGRWLNAATAGQRAVVLGDTAARRLGLTAGDQAWIGGRQWTVVGVLEPALLAAEIDVSALVGFPAARAFLRFDGHPTTIYTRADGDRVAQVRAVLARTANPEHPDEVGVSRPSDALAARAAAESAFTTLLLGVGAVALLVGGVGVANTMVVSVLERRREIGLRRALGATRRDIRVQFLAESWVLAGVGGVAGAGFGAVVTFGYAALRDLPAVLPWWAVVGGLAATLLVGTVAGIYPAMRAARMSPTLALVAS